MRIKKFRYITINDQYDADFVNFSRPYEYFYVLDALRQDNTIKTVHNTSCGGFLPVHQQFTTKLNELNKEITNSDVAEQSVKNFCIYNILDKPTNFYDCVLNISVLEDFSEYDAFEMALNNLLAMANKRLIITLDDNGTQVGFVQRFFGLAAGPLDDTNALRGGNSPYPNPPLNHLRIILLDIEK